MVADSPVEPHLLAQVTETSVDGHRGRCCARWRPSTPRHRGFVLVKIAGGYRFQSHPDLAAYVERFVLEGQTRPAVGRRARDAGHRGLQAADLAGPGRRDPRRQRRRRRAHPRAARLHRRDRPRSRARVSRCCSARRRCSSSAWAWRRSTTCRRSPTSCPAPTWSRRWRRGCVESTPDDHRRRAGRRPPAEDGSTATDADES